MTIALGLAPSLGPVPVPTAVLQRRCDCGKHTGGGDCGSCADDQVQRLAVAGPRPLPLPSRAISQPTDPAERAADRAAETLLSGPAPGVSPVTGPARRGSIPDLPGVPAIVGDVLRSGGSPLDSASRAYFEPRLGHDLGHVRVHTGERAAASAAAVSAHGYTVGSDLVLGRSADRRTLAHELAHAVGSAITTSGRRLHRQLAMCADLIAQHQPTSIVPGRLVHQMVEADFLVRVPNAMKVGIPGGTAAPQRTGGICGADDKIIPPQVSGGRAGMGWPDVARRNAGGVLLVGELKPAAVECLIDGEDQVMRYIDQGNGSDPTQQAWRQSLGLSTVSLMLPSTYTPPTLVIGTNLVRVGWCGPGLLAYAVTGRRVRVRVRVRAPEEERTRERNRYRESGRDLIPVATAVGATAVVAIAGRAAWSHFWKAVARRFALRGAIAVGLAAADGPLPFGELIDLGIGIATAIEIFVVWDDLWRQADQIAAEGA